MAAAPAVSMLMRSSCASRAGRANISLLQLPRARDYRSPSTATERPKQSTGSRTSPGAAGGRWQAFVIVPEPHVRSRGIVATSPTKPGTSRDLHGAGHARTTTMVLVTNTCVFYLRYTALSLYGYHINSSTCSVHEGSTLGVYVPPFRLADVTQTADLLKDLVPKILNRASYVCFELIVTARRG